MENKRQSHNNFHIAIDQTASISISSDFDSGNLQSVHLLSLSKTDHIKKVKLMFVPALEPFNQQYSIRPSTKTFFHFSLQCNETIVVHACIKRMNILSYLQSSIDEYYRICVGRKENKYKEPTYKKIKPDHLSLMHQENEYILEFTYPLDNNQTYFFAYHFPYSYEKLSCFLSNLQQTVQLKNQTLSSPIYFNNQLLIETLQSRKISLLTITQFSNTTDKSKNLDLPRESRISKTLFPFHDLQPRPYKFKKPIIMITCRVHPGQTSASFALEGFLKSLLGDSDESQFLRKCFVFLIVPMVNPDGVYHGTYRMDTLGHNLNRFYNNCIPHKQPAIFAIQSLIQYHSEQIYAFLDMHSHPQLKGSFIYGNSFSSIYDQIESQLFAKILSLNSECFSYELSSFSQKNMNSKDINELMSKDGSARVYAHKKMNNNIHCFTIEMGYHGCPVKKQSNRKTKYKTDYRRQTREFHQIDYMEHGIAMMNTFAQVYIESCKIQSLKNAKHLVSLREELGKQIYEKEERFKMIDIGFIKKIKGIHQTIYANSYRKLLQKYPHILEFLRDYDDEDQLKVTQCADKINKPIRSVSLSKKKRLQPVYESYSPPKQNQQEVFKIVKDKVNFVPLEFTMGQEPQKGKPSNKVNINFNPLPKIQKKSFKKMLERGKLQNQKRILSSVSSHKKLPEQESEVKKTIQSNMNQLLFCEKILNQENYVQIDEQLVEDQPSEQINKNMNILHNEMMYKRIEKSEELGKGLLKNYQTERISRRHQVREKKVSQIMQKYKSGEEKEKWLNLPRIEGRTEKIRTKFELELKMKEKYDKEYQIDLNWRVSPTEMETILK